MTILSFQNLLLLAIMASFLVTVSAFRGFSSVTKRSSFQIDSSLPSKEHEIVPRYIGNTQKSALFSTGFDKEPSSEGNFEYFELLELKIQANAIVEQQVTTARLAIEKRKELEGYCRKIVNRRESAIPLNKLDEYLPDSKWQLAFTTQNLSIESLPKDAIIKLEFGNENKMNYILEFTKTFGLNRLVAKSRYNVDTFPVNPGYVTYTYETISTDFFGLKNIGVPSFGALNGRSSCIQTAYFDGSLWVEAGNSGDYFNVYVCIE